MHQDDAASSQTLKQPRIAFDSLPKVGKTFLSSIEGREQGSKCFKNVQSVVELQTFAEDELVRKEYKEMRCEMPGTPRSTFLMVFSPDGTKVASTHGNHNIYVTDLRTGKNIKTLSGHPRTPWCIAFHPTSNQIVASGCLGGQVRIWDLSGGSEVWTTETQTVIASLAFHPNERLLVIATFNELYFWDWSQPNPFLHTCTNNVKEKVRYVAFDRLGHKLITGIANTPQTRWERVRAPVPVPRQAERSASPYRRRITQRLVTNIGLPCYPPSSGPNTDRESLAGIPERERRITVCYRNLVEQYELLVHRYLEIYRPATTIDRGTDPMEPYDQNRFSNPNNPTPSTSNSNIASSSNPSTSASTSNQIPTTSGGSSSSNINTQNNTPSASSSTQTAAGAAAAAEPNESANNQEEATANNTEPIPTTSTSPSAESYPKPQKIQFDLSKIRPAAGVRYPNYDPSPGPSGLSRFRSAKRAYPPFTPSVKRYQRNIRIQSSSDSSSSDDDMTLHSTSKRRTTEQGVGGGSSDGGRTNAPETNTTQSGNQFTVAQIGPSSGSSAASSPIPGGRRRLYCHHSSAFSPTKPSQTEGTVPPSPRLTPPTTTTSTSPEVEQQQQSTRAPPPVDIPSPLSRLRGISEGMLSSADELINFAERNSNRQEPEPFEPAEATNEFPTGTSGNVGNIYSNILSDLEYSLDNVRNMRVGERTNESTGVLSSFSQGLESIMSRSDAILRNLRQSLDLLLDRDLEIAEVRPAATAAVAGSRGLRGISVLRMQGRMQLRMNHRSVSAQRPTTRTNSGNVQDEQNFYVRYHQHPSFYPEEDAVARSRSPPLVDAPDDTYVSPTQPTDLSLPQQQLLSASLRNPIADHTYPRNPESSDSVPQSSSDYMAPLVTSLDITISRISRQARLLRRQVESIERIDRAMVEVSQLQIIRQMWVDVRSILSNLSEGARRVSSMRQMMAGTRISDSNPSSESSDPGPSGEAASAPPPAPEVPEQPPVVEQPPVAEQSPVAAPPPQPTTSQPTPQPSTSRNSPRRHGSRKTYPPSRLCRLQRQNRRYQLINPLRHRTSTFIKMERVGRERPAMVLRIPQHSANERTHITMETLLNMVQRLEYLLAEQTRNIGTQETTPREPSTSRRVRSYCERITVERLTAARARIHRMLHVNRGARSDPDITENVTAHTTEAISRMGTRLTLSAIVDTLSRFFEDHGTTLTPALRTQIKNVIELALLLTDIMLLQIVDSIPPPTGISLDPEREDLSARIDQMCSRMLANRLSSHSQQLTRSLRLMRLTARYASRALGITYQARRHALLPSAINNERRYEILNQINICLRNMHRRRGVPFTPLSLSRTFAPHAIGQPFVNGDLPTAEWCQSVRELLTNFLNLRNISSGPRVNAETGERNDASRAVPATPAPESAPPPPPRGIPPASPNDDAEIEPLLDFSSNDFVRNRPDTGAGTAAATAAEPLVTASSSRSLPLYRSPAMNLLGPELPERNVSVSRSWNVPTVQVNDMPVSDNPGMWFNTRNNPPPRGHRIGPDIRANSAAGLFRPRFLHPLYAGANPFDADLDDPQREQSMGYDADMITTPNHRIQVWDISNCNIPNISNPEKNIVVAECKIHNDASVDIAKDGTLLVTLLPSGGYLNVTNRLGVYSLRWETLGQCLFTTNFEQNAVSVSLSPLSRHLIVGLASRRVALLPTERWTMARIFFLDRKRTPISNRLPVLREIDQNRDSNYMSVNCIRWMPVSGQGLVYATNTGQLKVLS